MISVFEKYPDVRFDLYHLGVPYIRETLIIAKNNRNVWLNLCWTHTISESMCVAAVEEASEMVPMNRIIAFGGDYKYSVENVYGHLVMAKENIAEAFARRTARGNLSVSQAVTQIRKWFWDNPVELYHLDL